MGSGRGGEGLAVQEIQGREGSKNVAIHQGCGSVDFFWNNPNEVFDFEECFYVIMLFLVFSKTVV